MNQQQLKNGRRQELALNNKGQAITGGKHTRKKKKPQSRANWANNLIVLSVIALIAICVISALSSTFNGGFEKTLFNISKIGMFGLLTACCSLVFVFIYRASDSVVYLMGATSISIERQNRSVASFTLACLAIFAMCFGLIIFAYIGTNNIVYMRYEKTAALDMHTVKNGEDLESIANLYGLTIAKLAKLNDISEDYPILVDNKLRVK